MTRADEGAETAGYAGDVTPQAALDVLQREAGAVLVDVRTMPEWAYVGAPDLGALGKAPVFLEWQTYPSMQVAPDFADTLSRTLRAQGLGTDQPIFFLCRSGVRSNAAAIAMTGMGYSRCYNIAGGFEGGLDAQRHRGGRDGWKAAGLPWIQS
jgi:rhodanese-related sulfurtransferase